MYNAALFAVKTFLLLISETQRRIQFGVAKKIKNEARKIVLEKEEEARDAGFSAFKAGVATKKAKMFIPPSTVTTATHHPAAKREPIYSFASIFKDVNPFGGGNPLLTKETESEPIIWDILDEKEEYPFVNEYPKDGDKDEQTEKLLALVDQSSNSLMQEAVDQPKKALFNESLLKPSSMYVGASVASCLGEITIITTPYAPYGDEEMKEVFQLVVSSLEDLSDESSLSYPKRVSIVENIAKVKACLIVLDLECDDLIVEMFEHFMKSVWNACKPNNDDLVQPNHEIDVLAGHENDVNLIAIIWVPKSRQSHRRIRRWTLAYHLKVPPPPMPPQQPRGGPRQRILPTPRGVNMIEWSLGNCFILAAIMDYRIRVWNAVDNSLVHSLTGYNESTYVLDVYPFNLRIAMSAGYDGKTIVWDTWEGVPIRIFEIGRFKLVDGKFSPDGTSIVLFDEETQLAPYRRNMQDLHCDSGMIPYPDPYQSMYQQKRLGSLGFEWRPSSVRFAVGTEISLVDQEYQVPPVVDLDILMDPLLEFLDAKDWEPEIESKTKKIKAEADFMTSSGRRVKRRNLDGKAIASEDLSSHKDNPKRRLVFKLPNQDTSKRELVGPSSTTPPHDIDESSKNLSSINGNGEFVERKENFGSHMKYMNHVSLLEGSIKLGGAKSCLIKRPRITEPILSVAESLDESCPDGSYNIENVVNEKQPIEKGEFSPSDYKIQKGNMNNIGKGAILALLNYSSGNDDVFDLSPYSRESKDKENSRMSFSQAGEDNAGTLDRNKKYSGIVDVKKNNIGEGVKGIGRVSPMKSNVTPNNDSPRIVNDSDKAPVVAVVVKEKLSDVIEKSTGKPVVDAVNENDSKDKLKTCKPTDKVSKGKALDVLKVNESDKASVVNESDKAPVVKESDKAPVVAAVVKKKPAVADKHKADAVKPPNVVIDKAINVVVADNGMWGCLSIDVVPDNIQDDPTKVVKENVLAVVNDQASDVLKNTGKKSVIGKDKGLSDNPKDKPKNYAPSKEKAKPKVKAKPNPKQKVNPEVKAKVDVRIGKSKKEDSDSELETDEIVSSSDEVYRKPKKLKLKDGLKRNRNVSDSDSSSIDEENIKRLLYKLIKKVKKEESNEESVSKKGKKKTKKLTPVEAVHEEYLLSFQTLRVRTSHSHFYNVVYQPMGMSDGLKGQICWDVVRRLREDSLISDIDWCSYIYDCLQQSRLPLGTNHYLGPLTFLVELELKDHVLEVLELHSEWTEAEGQETEGFTGKKASLEYPGDGKFLDLHETYVKLFKNPISFDVDGNGDNDEDDGDDDADDVDQNEDDEDGNLDDDVRNVDDVGNGDDGGNVGVGRNKAVQENETIQENETVEENETVQKNETIEEQQDEEHLVVEEAVEENEILSTPETYTQWLDRNANFVGEGNVLDQVLENTKVVNACPVTPERMPTHLSKLSPSPRKRMVKPSSYLLSPYMNKKTNFFSKITKLEFIMGNSLFAMQGDKM
nr:PH-interacting protein [Tanacetum cinerariifolium]